MTAKTTADFLFDEIREIFFCDLEPSKTIIYSLEIQMNDYLNAPRKCPEGHNYFYSLYKCIALEPIQSLNIQQFEQFIIHLPEKAFINGIWRKAGKQSRADFDKRKKVLLKFKRPSRRKIEILEFRPAEFKEGVT